MKRLVVIFAVFLLLFGCSEEVVPEVAESPHPLAARLAVFHAGFDPEEDCAGSFDRLKAVLFSPNFSLEDLPLLEREDFHVTGQALSGEQGDVFVVEATYDYYDSASTWKLAWAMVDGAATDCYLSESSYLASTTLYSRDWHLFDTVYSYNTTEDGVRYYLTALSFDGQTLTEQTISTPYIDVDPDLPLTVTAVDSGFSAQLEGYSPLTISLSYEETTAAYQATMDILPADNNIGEYGLLLGITDRETNLRTLFIYPADGELAVRMLPEEILFEREGEPWQLKHYSVYEFFEHEDWQNAEYSLDKLLALPYGTDAAAIVDAYEPEEWSYGFWTVAEWPLYVGEDVIQVDFFNRWSGGGTFSSNHQEVLTLTYDELLQRKSADILDKGGYGYAYYENLVDFSLVDDAEDYYYGFPSDILNVKTPVLRRGLGQWRVTVPLLRNRYHPGNGTYSTRFDEFYDTGAPVPAVIFGDIGANRWRELGIQFQYDAWFGEEVPVDLLVSPDEQLAIYVWDDGQLTFFDSSEEGDWFRKKNGEEFGSFQLAPKDEIVSAQWIDSASVNKWLNLLDAEGNTSACFAVPPQEDVPLLLVTMTGDAEHSTSEILVEGDGIRQSFTLNMQYPFYFFHMVADYNFDGYLDLSFPVAWGAGPNVISDIYLWSPKQQKFEFWTGVMNPEISGDGIINSWGSSGYSTRSSTDFWVENNQLLLHAEYTHKWVDNSDFNRHVYLFKPSEYHKLTYQERLSTSHTVYDLYLNLENEAVDVYDKETDELIQTLSIPTVLADERHSIDPYFDITQADLNGDGYFDLSIYLANDTRKSEEHIFYWSPVDGRYGAYQTMEISPSVGSALFTPVARHDTIGSPFP